VSHATMHRTYIPTKEIIFNLISSIQVPDFAFCLLAILHS
jgi:hypothetical protein